ISITWVRRARSCSPACAVPGSGWVEISSTDSISSGLISPAGGSASIDSIALTRSSDSASRIISSSSMPSVYFGPTKLWSMPAPAYPGYAESSRFTRQEISRMALGYDGKLYILAFDHRGSFQKKMFGIEGDPTPEQTATISDAKHLIYEGMTKVVASGGVPGDQIGVLVDEQFGGDIPTQAKAAGLKLAMPVEKSGQDEFDFEYGDDFGAHIEKCDPAFSKGLVRYNPEGDTLANLDQLEKLKKLADWLHSNNRKFLFELLVPATSDQLGQVNGDNDRYDSELRPELMRRAIADAQDYGVEVDIWKIEGVDARED